MNKIIFLFTVVLFSCSASKKIIVPERNNSAISGTQFYKTAVAFHWHERDSFAVKEILAGNIPSFLKNFIAIHTQINDTNGKIIHATYFVAPDYLSVGSNDDWARIPLSPMAAQQIADSFHCFLPTRKMVNDIYKEAKIKLEPVPMYAFRDSTITMYQHHLIVEGQRKLRKGLIAGIKKDVVLSEKLIKEKPNHEAIYGWHKLDGKPIQSLYTGHINWWVDYSHGIRLIYRTIYVNGKAMDYIDVLNDAHIKKLLCDEDDCNFYRYSY
ncbi:MAG: hypothetical protein M3004_05685 [Bacteroidota bacterium]|nr:hypothetical protein [Bacteroidota bacterium]